MCRREMTAQTPIAETFDTFRGESYQHHAGGVFAGVIVNEHQERHSTVVEVSTFATDANDVPFEFTQAVDDYGMGVEVTPDALELDGVKFDKIELQKVI